MGYIDKSLYFLLASGGANLLFGQLLPQPPNPSPLQKKQQLHENDAKLVFVASLHHPAESSLNYDSVNSFVKFVYELCFNYGLDRKFYMNL